MINLLTSIEFITAMCLLVVVCISGIILAYRYLTTCKHHTVIKLSSIQKQKCADCYKMIDWPLKDGQQPLVSSSRDKRSK